ncbi:hypothetical protein [Butyrivibrio sp. WCD2001]|uniref:hypothetical protein n=1 Tax=Butyrivibrio sp. WCD2001 TaxID=1280681 RepID=UPI0004129145|nr:hypothetical protein [Butyrivibrio sp. WCD2001]
MSQYNSRLFVMVKKASVWKKLEEISFEKYGIGAHAYEVFNTKKKSVELDEFSCDDDQLLGLVKEIAKNIKNDGVVIADTIEYNVDPCVFGAYCFGGRVHSCVCEGDDDGNLQSDVEINDIQKWIELSGCDISKKEVSNLKQYSIKAKEHKPEKEESFETKIIVTDTEKGNIQNTLKRVPWLNSEKTLYDIITGPDCNLFYGDVYQNIFSASLVVPEMTENDIKEFVEKVKRITGARVYLCVWKGKSTIVNVWKCSNDLIEEIEVDEKEKLIEMEVHIPGYLPVGIDDFIDVNKYIEL